MKTTDLSISEANDKFHSTLDCDLTSELCFDLVKVDHFLLNKFPSRIMTEDFCIRIASYYFWALLYIPENLRTFNVIMAALKLNYAQIKNVPEEMFTEEMGLLVVEKCNLSFFYQLKCKKTPKMMLKFLNRNPEHFHVFYDIYDMGDNADLESVTKFIENLVLVEENKNKLKTKLESL